MSDVGIASLASGIDDSTTKLRAKDRMQICEVAIAVTAAIMDDPVSLAFGPRVVMVSTAPHGTGSRCVLRTHCPLVPPERWSPLFVTGVQDAVKLGMYKSA